MISFARTVALGSLASCPSCGGLVVVVEVSLGLVTVPRARHLTGDTYPRSCPRRGFAWASKILMDPPRKLTPPSGSY